LIISDINSPIPIDTIYPDRITLQCDFYPLSFVPMPVYWHRLRRLLSDLGIRTINWSRKEIELDINYCGRTFPIKCKLLCPGINKPLYIYFSINPVTIRNQLRGVSAGEGGSEIPFVSANNYLRLDDAANPMDIAHEVDAFVSIVQGRLTELIDTFYCQFVNVPITYCDIQIQHIEVCVDISCNGVGDTLQLFTDVFPSAFKQTKQRTFRSSESVFGSDEEVQFVEGYYRSGVRAKLYEKTDRRLRAEISFTKTALKYRSVDTRIVGDNNFIDFFPGIAQLSLPLFQMFLTPLSTANDQALSVSDIEAFAAIVSRASPRGAINAVNRLINMRRITPASMPRARRQQLLDAGILERVDRGVLRLVPRYRQALERIQSTLSNDEVA